MYTPVIIALKSFFIVVNTRVCRCSVDNKAAILSYPINAGNWRKNIYCEVNYSKRVFALVVVLCIITLDN